MTYTTPELLLIIGALSAAGVAVITAWRTKGAVDDVHVLVNDRATKQDELNLMLRGQIEVLIATIAAQDKQQAIVHDRTVQSAAIQQGVLSERTEHAKIATTEIENNVEEIKEDVKAVQIDVKDVKAEVIPKKTKSG